MKIIFLFILTVIALSHLFIAISYAEEQKQIQVNTKMNIPEKIFPGETVDFTIDVTYNGPFSWVKNLEPKFEIVPSRAESDINIQYDDSISDFTIWNGHIHTVHGTLHASEDTLFEAIYLSVSFEGDIRFDEQVVSVDPDSTVSLIIGSQSETSSSQNPQEEHYNIEIIGLKDQYEIGEEYSFYFVISGYGYSCANYDTRYPDENGNIIGMGAEVLCAAETSMHEFEINYLENHGALGNVGIKNPGAYSVSVTFDQPSKYYPTTASKDFRVFEFPTKLSPLKQFKSGIAVGEIQCRDSLILVIKYNGAPACIKSEHHKKLFERGWTKFTPVSPEIGKTGKYSLEIEDGSKIDIKYSIEGAVILSMNARAETESILINLDAPYDGSLTISIPRQIADAKDVDGVNDIPFIVLVEGEEVSSEEISSTSEDRTLTVPFEKRTKEIEIIGADYV